MNIELLAIKMSATSAAAMHCINMVQKFSIYVDKSKRKSTKSSPAHGNTMTTAPTDSGTEHGDSGTEHDDRCIYLTVASLDSCSTAACMKARRTQTRSRGQRCRRDQTQIGHFSIVATALHSARLLLSQSHHRLPWPRAELRVLVPVRAQILAQAQPRILARARQVGRAL